MRLTWSAPADLLPHALAQAHEEDIDVADLAGRWTDAGGSTEPQHDGAGPAAGPALGALAAELLDEIDRRGAGSPATTIQPPPQVAPLPGRSAADLEDRVRGAWLGRAIGCVLGKPVEKIPRAGIRAIAQATGNWPIRSYFTAEGLPAEVAARWPWNRRSRGTSLLETLDGIPEDDDLNFTLLALALVERHGAALTTADVAQSWLDNLPAGRVFTAERAVYRNLLLAVPPEQAALVRNPFREWIGAQIRTDLYGWVRPGDPTAAARLADADALLSHRRDGVYGARWVAAMSSAALVSSTVEAVIEAGLSVVPAESRLATAVRFGVELAAATDDSEAALDRLHAAYGHYHWVHVLNNAALVAYALTAGGGDLGSSIGLAVTGGWDTDSDGATVGAICGALRGAAALPARWTTPLGDRFRTGLPGFDGVRVDEVAARTLAAAA